MEENGIYYSDYLGLDKILDAQHPESVKAGIEAHDEMLFIVVHQAYELWFKQILYELNSIINILSKPTINDNSPDLQIAFHRLARINRILELLVHQIDIMETMTSLDFLDFRDLLRPASGFQSVQFKLLEAMLGLKTEERHGKEYFLSHLKDYHREVVQDAENAPSMIQCLNAWLERMPYFETSFWPDVAVEDAELHFWRIYRNSYEKSLLPQEMKNLDLFDDFLLNDHDDSGHLSRKARRSALFVILYRSYPLLHLPFQLLDNLITLDEYMSLWRNRHVNMVHRMIGLRVGTGGSSGKNYLKEAADKHYIFKELAELSSFLIERGNLPKLPNALSTRLGFSLQD